MANFPPFRPEYPLPVSTAGENSVQPESVWLHEANCTESPQDLQRMRDLIEKDPSLLYNIQPVRTSFGLSAIPLWHACQAEHLSCVKLILEASGPNNIKLLDNFRPFWTNRENVLTFAVFMSKDREKWIEIIKTLLDHGISFNLEIDASEISNCEIKKILEQYQTKTLIFPSGALHAAVTYACPKILELLFKKGVYPDPVILTESGSILPLCPTLSKHLNPIPAIVHRDLGYDFPVPLLAESFIGVNRSTPSKHRACMKTLLVHGASLPPYSKKRRDLRCDEFPILLQALFPFDTINQVCDERKEWNQFQNHQFPANGDICVFSEVILPMLKLYHQFGGSLWWKMKSKGVPCEGGKGECVEWQRDPNVKPCKNIIEHLMECIEEEEERSLVVGEVQRMMSTPPSLQHSARLAIRRAMGYGCVRNVEALPVPAHLKKYLKFEMEV